MNILHITVHMGGGAGHAISDLAVFDRENIHRIAVLQKPEKREYIEKCEENGVEIVIEPEEDEMNKLLVWADVAVLSWWHHPIMCRFLREFPDVPVRMVVWSHVSGCNYPYLSPGFADMFDRILITSRCILDNPFWSEDERAKIERKCVTVYGLGKTERAEKTRHSEKGYRKEPENDGKTVAGYVGTLAKSKLHPDFVKMCRKILDEVPNAEFVLAGDRSAGNWIEEEARESGISDRIRLIGYRTDVPKLLSTFDIFAYPLNPQNFATTENSILEAMNAGLPAVLMDQGTEKYIVTDGKDGLLADSTDDFVNKAVMLLKNRKLREKIGSAAEEAVRAKFSFDDNLCRFRAAVSEISLLPKRPRSFSGILGDTGLSFLLSGANPADSRKIIEKRWGDLPDIFMERSKSSLMHFSEAFPKDQDLINAVSEAKYIRNNNH